MRMVIWNLEYGICIKVCCFLVLNMAQMYMCHPAVCFFLRAWGKQKKKKKKKKFCIFSNLPEAFKDNISTRFSILKSTIVYTPPSRTTPKQNSKGNPNQKPLTQNA